MCSYDCSVRPTDIDGDNDITGIGVLIGYCATAGIAVFIIVFHYCACYDPRLDLFRENQANPLLCLRSRTNPIDDVILRGPRELYHKTFGSSIRGRKNRARLEDSFIKCILSMSDIQIITGISIIISGATQLKCGISTYQWQVLVYLAWFSSVTHLSCLTLLRKYLHQRPAERIWRLVCMFILVILLNLAFLPTANYRWQYGPAGSTGRPAPQDYAICYLRPVQRLNAARDPSPSLVQNDHTFSDHAIIAMSISVILMSVGFLSRVLKLYHSPSTFIAQTVRGRVSYMLRKPLRVIERSCDTSSFLQRAKRLLLYRPLLALFLTARILVDMWDSMFFEVWWLIISFIWGVARLFGVVALFPSEEDAQWSFGQVMSVALLAIPLISVFELLYPESNTHKEIEESQDIICSFSLNGSENPFDLQDLSQQPAPISRDLARRSFNDHPDYELYYVSGSLTVPTLTLILAIISLSLWCLVRACTLNGMQDEEFLQISFYPWGVVPLVLIFCIFSSILFSFMISGLESKRRYNREANSLLVRSLPVLITIVLTGTTFVVYAFSATALDLAGWIASGVFGFYCLCSLFASVND